MTNFFLAALLTLTFQLFIPAPANAASDSGIISDATLYPFIQKFTWEEFGEGGDRLLKESGPQYGVGGDLTLSLLSGDAGSMNLRIKQELYGGEVDYDGQLQDGTPHSTEVDYFGSYSEVDLGWAIPYRNSTIEPFGGLSYRWWNRDLQGLGGYSEEWSSVAVHIGARSRYALAADSSFFVSGAAKYPLETVNLVDYPGMGEVELKPDGDWSVFAEAGIVYRHLMAGIYYENFIFPKSPVESGLYQPRSESEIIGIKVGWSFR